MPIRLIDFRNLEVYGAGAVVVTLLAYPDASEETLGEVHASLCAYALNVKCAVEPDLAIRPQAIEGDGDQGGMPALALVTRDMLHRGAARFADELGKAGLMHSMPARRIKAGCADMVQALDQTEHRDRLRRFRHLAQPSEPALVGFPPTLRQHIQPTTLVGREPVGQPALDLATRAESASASRADTDTTPSAGSGYDKI